MYYLEERHRGFRRIEAMLIDSTVIEVIKGGAGLSPDYSITIYGDGKVIYDGKENVKVKGIVEDSIDNDKVLLLLSELKEADFFSLNDTYLVSDSFDRPYTVISVSIHKESGETVTKHIKFHHGNRNVPKELKTLEEKIDEIVDSDKWIGKPSEVEGFELKKEDKPSEDQFKYKVKDTPLKAPKKKPIKLVTIGVITVVAVCVLLYGIYSGIISLPTKEKGTTNGSSIEYRIPEINVITTASNISGFKDYNETNSFEQGDTIYVYQEYYNISTIDGTKCDIRIDIRVSLDYQLYHADSYYETDIKVFSKYNFSTNESWSPGNYLVQITLVDNISKNFTISYTNFVLVRKFEENPEITVFETASEVRAINDYDPETIFSIGEKICIYQEYTNITTIENDTCDIYINIIVNTTVENDSIIFHLDGNYSKITGNYGYKWWFITDEVWPTGQYYVTSNLIDNITNKSTSKTTTFLLIM